MIELNHLRKVYRMGDEKIVALDDITLNFEKEKIYCLAGKSGSGKSTLLNMMAGLEKPSKGNILFNGQRFDQLSENKLARFRQKYIGFVFQSYNLLPTLTALENVTLPLIFRAVPKKMRDRKAMEMLTAVGLADRWRHKPGEMSGGQQQRVSIARAFINNPQVVFADEPTGNLDTKTTAEMMDLITGLARRDRQTLIIVTHNLDLADYADYLVQIQDGSIENMASRHSNLVYQPGMAAAEGEKI
ncbi:MAG: ABC transporter ATP-binding protein [Clostridiales bacterium]|jgi:putative ABC transport system ATP-binding protein|nr:ABC transporter ATP-binding protein [Clostridiales bacterium]